jgi:hypothetical protein
VTGETTTDYLGGSNNITKEAFLLEVKKQNGEQKRFEVVGLQLGTDLHLTNNDHNAVIMGNTEFSGFGNQDITTSNTISNTSSNYPYLIERYENVDEDYFETRVRKAKGNIKKIESREFKVDVEVVTLRQRIECKNVLIKPTPSF